MDKRRTSQARLRTPSPTHFTHSNLFEISDENNGESSNPIPSTPISRHAAKVVPEPRNGSTTSLAGRFDSFKQRSTSSRGNIAGWRRFFLSFELPFINNLESGICLKKENVDDLKKRLLVVKRNLVL